MQCNDVGVFLFFTKPHKILPFSNGKRANKTTKAYGAVVSVRSMLLIAFLAKNTWPYCLQYGSKITPERHQIIKSIKRERVDRGFTIFGDVLRKLVWLTSQLTWCQMLA